MVACLKSGWIGTGPRFAQFERDFAAYQQAEVAVAVGSCTAAMHLSLATIGLAPGDEVITSALTFCSTVNSIIHAGGQPVLADVDPRTMNIDPADVRDRITARTRAIVPVHFAGRPCDMDALKTIADQHDLVLVEDCAHAIEARYRGRPVGAFGDFGCFSFYATKNLTTAEGGMVLVRDPDDGEVIRRNALHGLSVDAWGRFGDQQYCHAMAVDIGFKYNMTDLQASLGIHQLRRVEDNLGRREAIWAYYDHALSELPVARPADPDTDTRHARHLYTVLVGEDPGGIARDDFLQGMHARRIGVGVHYLGIAEHPVFQARYGWRPEDWPHAMATGRRTASLPLGSGLSMADAERVVRAVADVLRA